MNSDDSSRNMHYSQNRKPGMSKTQGYSPSMNYNYNGNQPQHGNHGNHTNHGNSNYGNQQHQRRKPAPFKRDNHGANDRIVKQNDIIIRLLKEIRDRLPEPPKVESENDGDLGNSVSDISETTETTDQDTETEATDDQQSMMEPQDQDPVAVDDDDLDSKVNGNI